MAKELPESINKLKKAQLHSLLNELDVTFDTNLKNDELIELLKENLPEGKTINESGELVEEGKQGGEPQGEEGENSSEENGSEDEDSASRSEQRRQAAMKKALPKGKVRLTDNAKFKGKLYKKGDIIEVNEEEEEMLVKSNLVEFF